MNEKLPKWDVRNDADIIKMLWYLSTYHGNDCADCKVVCCANQFLSVSREEIKIIAEYLKMDVSKFRFKHTLLVKNVDRYFSKKFGKDIKFKTGSDAAEKQMNEGGRLLLFDFSDDKIMVGEDESLASYCPFYNKETHRCKIHKVRPNACRIYPYEILDDKWVELRKVNDCLVSTNFLSRFSTLMSKAEISSSAGKVIDDINKVLVSKEYHNRFVIHKLLLLQYLVFEFALMGEEKLVSDLMKRAEADFEEMVRGKDKC